MIKMFTKYSNLYSIYILEQLIYEDRPDIKINKRLIHVCYSNDIKSYIKIIKTANPSRIIQIGEYDMPYVQLVCDTILEKYKEFSSNGNNQWFLLTNEQINELLEYLNQQQIKKKVE